jgi:hypothetical protein
MKLFQNHWANESAANTVPRPKCHCLDAQYEESSWSELRIHTERQDVECAGWKRLNELVEEAIRDKPEVFSPARVMHPTEWAQITELPRTIGKLKSVKRLILYGSGLVRIPPEIGEMVALEEFAPYTSYRLHWFPYEITRCSKLKDSTVSTRALYGNYKYRPPFPKLPQIFPALLPEHCSICRGPFREGGPLQCWISLRVATDVLPLLVHACSDECISKLPPAPRNYVPLSHHGGLDLQQPNAEE